MQLYCNDCGNGFHPPGDPDAYQMRHGCICPKCLHEAGDCASLDNACEPCREQHGGHDSPSRYCWFCVAQARKERQAIAFDQRLSEAAHDH